MAWQLHLTSRGARNITVFLLIPGWMLLTLMLLCCVCCSLAHVILLFPALRLSYFVLFSILSTLAMSVLVVLLAPTHTAT